MKKIGQAQTETLKIVLTGLILLTTINIVSATTGAYKGFRTVTYDIVSKIYSRHDLAISTYECSSGGSTVSPPHIQVNNQSNRIKRRQINKCGYKAINCHNVFIKRTAKLDSVTRLLRLKLYVSQYNYDDIAIGFNSGASFAYDPNEDSEYMVGIDALEGLASYSSDGVGLSINFLPLPKQSSEVIRLNVEAANSGNITLKRTELDSIPSIYSLWLVDKYKKDSIDLRVDSNYVFYINKADTATYGSYRFTVVVSQNPAARFELTGFNAIKAPGGVQLSWLTKNEGNDTHFDVERSTDGGGTFEAIDALTSASTGTYSFTDRNPPAAPDKYRLKITDWNGAITYSNEITLVYANMANTVKRNISVYPNPASGMLNLTINQPLSASLPNPPDSPNTPLLLSPAAAAIGINPSYDIKIINITGSVVKQSVSSSSNWQSDISRLLPGTYIIQVQDKTSSSVVGRGTFVKM